MSTPYVALGICGWKDAGKTTLIERLLPPLQARGLRVAVVKHDAHGLDVDRPGKDSDRFFQAGADVFLRAPDQAFFRIQAERVPTLDELLTSLGPRYDLILVEGHKGTPIPKLWLLGPDEAGPPPGVTGILAILPRDANRVQAALAVLDNLTAGTAGDLRMYDDFTAPQLDPGKWRVARLPLGDGPTWEYYDPNTVVKTGHGRCEITVDPFSRSHDEIQIADNPKTLFVSARPLEVPPNGVLTVSAEVGAVPRRANPLDIWDGFITLNLCDFESGIVLDFLLNGHLIYALYERLYMPGVTDETAAFTKEANLAVPCAPGRLHDCTMRYDRASDTAEWLVGGELAYRVTGIPVPVKHFALGMGLMTLKPIVATPPHYSRKSTSVHGQGMTGIWSKLEWAVEDAPGAHPAAIRASGSTVS